MVSAENATAMAMEPQLTFTRRAASTLKNRVSSGLMQRKVMPIPATPLSSPNGMAIAPKTAPSKNTLLRFWARVAPTLDSIPRYRLRSEREMAKAL